MPVDTKHEQFQDFCPDWHKTRDCVAGQRVIKEQNQLYLPKLEGQDDDEYNAYLERALFFNATQRTVDAMRGLLFRKNPVQLTPGELDELLEDIDLRGNTLNDFVEKVADEVLTTGRYGILTEHTPAVINEDGLTVTLAQAEAEGARPFLTGWTAESIYNWNTDRINGRQQLNLVVLREQTDLRDSKDEFELEEKVFFRVLDLNEEGHYRQRVFEQIDETQGKKTEVTFRQAKEEIIPLMEGKPIDFIPFVFISKTGLESDIERSPIIDLVDVNLSHYRSSADIEHAAHFTALPTAVITGHTMTDGQSLRIGSQQAWILENSDADAKFLEFTGGGLEALETRLEKKQEQMAVLGARMLVAENKAAEKVETHAIKRQGENSALGSIGQSISNGIIKSLTWLAAWANVSGEIDYELNKDFMPVGMTALDLTALLASWQGGAIAFSDLHRKLVKGEIIAADRSVEDIKVELDAEGPTGSFSDDAGLFTGVTNDHEHTYVVGAKTTGPAGVNNHIHKVDVDGSLMEAEGHTHSAPATPPPEEV